MTSDLAASRWYHKTAGPMAEIKPFLHVGTMEQANMRAVGLDANVLPLIVDVQPHLVKRLRDTGSWDERKLRALQRKGWQAVVYLNRFEGIPLEEFEAARAAVGDIDRLSDAQFRRLLPSARDSLIVFDPAHVRFALVEPEMDPDPSRVVPGF